jgi:exopolysaccharide biosynthesis polyprenyl glycosylphosphotransferase
MTKSDSIDLTAERASADAAVETSALPAFQSEPIPVSRWLRRTLVLGDAFAIAFVWIVILITTSGGRHSGNPIVMGGKVVALIATGLLLIRQQKLYLARVTNIRTVEFTRLARVSALLAGAALSLEALLPTSRSAGVMVVGGFLSLFCLAAFRSGYRAWIRGRRARGSFRRSVLILGVGRQTGAMIDRLDDHREFGYKVVGVAGDRDAALRYGLLDLWIGPVDVAVRHLRNAAGSGLGAIIAGAELNSDELDTTVRKLVDAGVHVQLSMGTRGIGHRRLRAMQLGHEPIFYVERTVFTRGQLMMKRALDLTLGSVLLVFSLPLLAISAIAIKLQDGGPVLFRQVRVGLDARPFTLYKLRTMVVGAEARLEELRAENARTGPLFKMDHDPRVTRIGRVLRALSLDELPQLFNVMKGEMSLVGPRPALATEVDTFGDRLRRDRLRVLPGITGLWQVEARDNPSFASYERLDLFYVDNWSIGFDIVILITTVEAELGRILHKVFSRRAPVSVEIDLTSSEYPAAS